MMYKIWRSPFSRFGGLPSDAPDEFTDETITAVDVYTDGELARIAGDGFNAIWIHALLHHIVQAEPYSELGVHAERHQAALRQLIERAARHGIKIFLYMEPPRAIEQSNRLFWDNHPEAAGCDVNFYGQAQVRTLCTSLPAVKAYLEEAARILGLILPDLGGVILITDSEFPSHCRNLNNVNPDNPGSPCPRCAERAAAEVIAEIITLIYSGIRSHSASIEVVAWNWGWEHSGLKEIISRLPEGVILMGDFERNGYADLPEYPRFRYTEYSLAYPGPCEAFLETRKLAEKYRHRIMAKLQLGTTHELGSAVSLPAVFSILEKAKYLRSHGIDGMLCCWNFGNFGGVNVKAFHFFLKNPDIRAFAATEFPQAEPEKLLEAWDTFRRAMLYFPNVIPVLYRGPQNHALADIEAFRPGPRTGTSGGRSWLLDERGDDFSQMDNQVFSEDEIIERFGKLALLWQEGCMHLEKALGDKYPREYGNARIVGAAFKSTENLLRIHRLRQNWSDRNLPWFQRIVQSELQLVEDILPFAAADPNQGYHAEAGGWMFSEPLLRKKIEFLKQICHS